MGAEHAGNIVMDLQLSGKVCLVSGSSRGIGKVIGETLAREGCLVYLNGRDPATLTDTVNEIKTVTGNPQVNGICGDFTQAAPIAAGVAQILAETGQAPELTVANLGSGRAGAGWDVDDEEWDRVFQANFWSAVRLVREAIRARKSNGSIVCISSITGCNAIPAPIPYSAAKTALLSFVKNTADVIARDQFRLNAISPGNVMFPGSTWDLKQQSNPTQVAEYLERNVPMNAFASPEDIAQMTAFILSARSGFVTGANIVVDGGQSRKVL